MSDRVFKVFMGLITAPAIAFALDYLVHDAFNNSDHSIVVTVAGSAACLAAICGFAGILWRKPN